MLTGNVTVTKGTRHYVREVYYGGCWSSGISAIRRVLRTLKIRKGQGKGILTSGVSGQVKIITQRTIREV